MDNQRLLVGIDFSKKRADLALLKSDGELLIRHRAFTNTQVGFEQLKQLLLQSLGEQGFSGLDVAGEATSYYWLPLFMAIGQDPELAAHDVNLFLLNPKWVRWYKRSQPSNHKNDQMDPQYIGDYLRTHRPATVWHYDARWMPIRFYTRLRFHLVKSLGREKNLFNLYLFLAYTTYDQRQPFANPLTLTSQSLLQDPLFLTSLQEGDLDEVAEALDAQSRHLLGDPQESARRLQQVLAERYQLPDGLAVPIQRGIGLLIDTIHHLEDQITQVEGWISAMVKTGYPEVGWLRSIPGIGPVFSSGIAAEIGDVNRFLNVLVWDDKRNRKRPRYPHELADAIGKYAGLWWPDNSSGNFHADEKRMSREGNAYLRYYILEAADRMRQRLPRFAQYYRHKYDQATHHKHKRALVLTGRKALNLMVALLHHQEPYRAKEVQPT